MFECELHGTRQSIICCRHVEAGLDGSLTGEIEDYIFDDYETGFLVCASCVEPVRQYVKARTDEELEACSFAYHPECLGCLEVGLQKTKYGSFAGLKRALGTPERG